MINQGQERVVYKAKTPAAIIAGPGTGKTYTIVNKVVHLVKDCGLAPNKILITTFTKKAARELNVRILTEFNKEGIGEDLNDLKIGNFHSLAMDFIEKYKKLGDDFFTPRAIDEYTQTYILEKNLDIFKNIEGYETYIGSKGVYGLIEIYGSITNNLIDLDTLRESKDPRDNFAYEVYRAYENLFESMGLMNFQMILQRFNQMLIDEEIGPKIRKDIDFVIIDEYQDTNYIQQEIAFNLVRGKDIMVFGDDDQALYRFRGADPKNLTQFNKVSRKKLGVDANFYSLDINYRSNQAIIDISKAWLNEYRDYDSSKPLKAIDDRANENTVVRARAGEYKNLLKIIRLLNKDIGLNQMAFLFPSLNSSYPKSLQKFFESQGLSVINFGRSSYFDRREIRLLIYILARTYTAYPSNTGYQQGLSGKELKKLYYRRYLKEIFDDPSIKSKEMDQFINTFSKKKPKTMTDLVYKAFELPMLREILDKKLGSMEDDRALSNIGRFTSLLAEFEEIFAKDDKYEIEFIYGYLFNLYSKNAIKENDQVDNSYEAINFMTIHNSKGLEFDVVFVSGLNDFPRDDGKKILAKYERSEGDPKEKYKDFYRKYYTAFTRAKNLLVLLDNSNDPRISDFAKKLNDSSKLSSIDFIRRRKEEQKPIFAYTTDIEVYDTCPVKYKFMRKLGFAIAKSPSLIRGTRIHDLAEYIAIKPKLEDKEKVVSEVIRRYPAYKDAIMNFYRRSFRVGAREVNYKLDRNFYILQGNIDLILKDGSIMDLKTGSYDKISLEKYKKQVLTYKHLVNLNGDRVGDLYLYFIEKDELIEVYDELYTIDYIDHIAKSIIDLDLYEKTSDTRVCKFCPMKYYCKRY